MLFAYDATDGEALYHLTMIEEEQYYKQFKPNNSMSNSDFLPDGYEAPKSSTNYLKLEKGENRFRILSRPIIGWLDWQDNKPLRFRMDQKPKSPVDSKKPIKHFWAFVVWDYKTASVRILEITQATIQQAITGFSRDADWGNPFDYDIKVMRTGDGMETEYAVNPVPHKKAAPEIMAALVAKPVNLDALYDGEDPFAVTPNNVKLEDDLPF